MINYPNRKQNSNNPIKVKSHSYRGANLEEDLNQTNQYYLDLNKANIYPKRRASLFKKFGVIDKLLNTNKMQD